MYSLCLAMIDADGLVAGCISGGCLEAELVAHADRTLKIGSFSAASNVTGIVSNTCAIADVLHRHGALSFWDFAAAGPYVKIEMNMQDQAPDGAQVYKDAIPSSSLG